MEFKQYADSEMMMIDLAGIIAGELRMVLSHDDTATLAVPGGTTPGPIFDSLCAAELDWPRINVMLTDERWVPEASDRSNTRLIKQRLLTGLAASANLVPLYADAASPEHKLEQLSDDVTEALPLTCCLLGMGEDMHTASIFPGADRLEKALKTEQPLVPMRAAGAPEPRITLSAHAINSALHKHVVIIGDNKRAALEAAQSLTPMQAPIMSVLQGATVHWARS